MPFISSELIDSKQICNHPEHTPPTHIVLRPGKHVWQCPSCGKQQVINVPLIN